jgi:hypothetical protein
MTRDREHFQLTSWQAPRPHRRRNYPPPVKRASPHEHAAHLDQQAAVIAEALELRQQQAPLGIDPKLVFKLRLAAHGQLDEKTLHTLGLHLLGIDGTHALVVFPDEVSLTELRDRLREYAASPADHPKYAYLGIIEDISSLTPEDRVGARLRVRPLVDDEVAYLDVALWSSNKAEFDRRVNELRGLLERESRGLAITDQWLGDDLALLRVRLDGEALGILLQVDYVKEIERRPQPAFEMLEIRQLNLDNLEPPSTDIALLPGILVVDSGLMQGHPLLRDVVGEARVFPDGAATLGGGSEDADTTTPGHGTAVAGIAVYNDVGLCINRRQFVPSATVFSARVTDEHNHYFETELLEHQLADAVAYFLDAYPAIRVINISLGNADAVDETRKYQWPFAAAIDKIAYQHRNRKPSFLFVVSTGNYYPHQLTAESVMQQYPNYLLDPKARVVDPAMAALALTVGGLSYGQGRDQRSEDRITRVIPEDAEQPSPFTRAGWGWDGAIKPEVVDFAGAFRIEDKRIWNFSQYAGIPSLAKNFTPPDGQLFQTVAGTSFAAPRVANIAARLFNDFPGASANLIRALIVNSARLPDQRPLALKNLAAHDEKILKLYGYGQPDYARARWSAHNDVVLLAEDMLPLDSFQLYQIPALPDDFFAMPGRGFVSVTLAFDPDTRQTRADNYLGTTMDFTLYRNVDPAVLADWLGQLTPDEREALGDEAGASFGKRRIQMTPGVIRRRKATVQRAVWEISRRPKDYDDQDLTLVVTAHGTWARAHPESQPFALVVSLLHDSLFVDLYAHIRQHAQVLQRARVRV